MAMPGAYKNFDDLEESLSLPELEVILKATRDRRHEEQRFQASLVGIEIEDNSSSDENGYAEVERRAQERIAAGSGIDLESVEWSEMGINFNSEE